eukprot:9834-Heterococcus_DN1.PRE.11
MAMFTSRTQRNMYNTVWKPTSPHYCICYATTLLPITTTAAAAVVASHRCDCVNYIRSQRTGVASFIPLDKIRPKPINERLRTLGNKYRLCADIVQCDEKIRPAVAFAVSNTVVADSLEDARELCFDRNERVKCVTLQGALIAKGGNMTVCPAFHTRASTYAQVVHEITCTSCGTTARDGGSAAARWDEQEVQELKKQRDELRTELAALGRKHMSASIAQLRIRSCTSRACLQAHSVLHANMCICIVHTHYVNKVPQLTYIELFEGDSSD